MIMIGITLGAIRFITETITTEVEASAADLTASVAEIAPAAMKVTGPPTRTPSAAAGLKTALAQRPGLLKETITPLEDTLNPAVKAVRARAPSVGTTMADRQGAFRHAEVPASVAEQHVEAVAGVTNRGFVVFPVVCKIRKWRKVICGERS
jgi:hypothetical protein